MPVRCNICNKQGDKKGVQLVSATVTDSVDASGRGGEIVDVGPLGLEIQCATGRLLVDSIKLEGKGTMDAAAAINGYPNLLKLAAFAITCPLQTADCERGFSVQNRILTPLRNRLSIDTQNKLMSVKLGSVDLAQALTKWKETPRLLYGQSNRT